MTSHLSHLQKQSSRTQRIWQQIQRESRACLITLLGWRQPLSLASNPMFPVPVLDHKISSLKYEMWNDHIERLWTRKDDNTNTGNQSSNCLMSLSGLATGWVARTWDWWAIFLNPFSSQILISTTGTWTSGCWHFLDDVPVFWDEQMEIRSLVYFVTSWTNTSLTMPNGKKSLAGGTRRIHEVQQSNRISSSKKGSTNDDVCKDVWRSAWKRGWLW